MQPLGSSSRPLLPDLRPVGFIYVLDMTLHIRPIIDDMTPALELQNDREFGDIYYSCLLSPNTVLTAVLYPIGLYAVALLTTYRSAVLHLGSIIHRHVCDRLHRIVSP